MSYPEISRSPLEDALRLDRGSPGQEIQLSSGR